MNKSTFTQKSYFVEPVFFQFFLSYFRNTLFLISCREVLETFPTSVSLQFLWIPSSLLVKKISPIQLSLLPCNYISRVWVILLFAPFSLLTLGILIPHCLIDSVMSYSLVINKFNLVGVSSFLYSCFFKLLSHYDVLCSIKYHFTFAGYSPPLFTAKAPQ